MRLSVVIPCYNEQENVPRIAAEALPVLDGLGYAYEVIIIDDGSKDATVTEAKKILSPCVRLVEHGVNKGLGAALRTGIAAAQGELVVFLDSDLTFSPLRIPDLLRAYESNPGIDFVIGSPYLGGFSKDVPAWRIWISKLANAVYIALLGEKTTSINPIFRLYKTTQLKALSLEAVGFDINAEILFKLVFQGKRFVEVPAELTNRLYGVSKLNYAKEIRRHLVLMFKILKWKMFGFSSTR